ncbi:MAG: hypothetical protein KTR31_20885 [Myxococcales bacterium]|nr:hypothetical protein [Myxococcales bacterium]
MRTLALLATTALGASACVTDIEVTRVGLPETACPGQDIGGQTQLGLINNGTEPVNQLIQIGWYLSSDATLSDDDVLLSGGRDQVEVLPANSEITVDVSINTIPEDAMLGEQYVIVFADELDQVDERVETNNVVATAITIVEEDCELDTGPQIRDVSAGGRQTCAVLTTGAVRCWGLGEFGVLGYGNTDNVGDDETPASVGDVPLTGLVIDVEAGFYHTCALMNGGGVRCWGRNNYGQLGLGHTSDIGDDEDVSGLVDIDLGGAALQLAAGVYHTCALMDTGDVRCWGWGSFGALGYGNTDDIGDDESPSAVGVVPLGDEDVLHISAGDFHTCATFASGDVRCWGGDTSGSLGIQTPLPLGDDELPTTAKPVAVGSPASATAAGSAHSCALLSDSGVRCWGAADRLGYGGTDNIGDDESPSVAGNVPVGVGAVDLTAGGEHTCALTAAGNVRCWGYVVAGGMGYASPDPVVRPDLAGDVDVGGPVRQIEAGYGAICALLESGGLRCWGNGVGGKLGYGNENAIGDDETPASVGDVPVL